MASKGVWVEFDGISSKSIDQHSQMLKYMKDEKLLHQVLISQDAGWYHVGEKNGGDFHSFTTIFKEFIPKLKSVGFTEGEIDMMIRRNPAEAFAVRVRKN
jgi:phosphotriesterase-related protein